MELQAHPPWCVVSGRTRDASGGHAATTPFSRRTRIWPSAAAPAALRERKRETRRTEMRVTDLNIGREREEEREREKETDEDRRGPTAALIKTAVSLEVPLRVVSKWKSKYRRACWGVACRYDLSPPSPPVSLFSVRPLRSVSLVVDENLPPLLPFSPVYQPSADETSNPCQNRAGRIGPDGANRVIRHSVKLESSLRADIGSGEGRLISADRRQQRQLVPPRGYTYNYMTSYTDRVNI